MNFQHLKTFCTVLIEKSMTAASQKLFLTQPAVSQQIRNLEEELGVDLLVRGVRHIKPTSQGQLLFEYSQKIIHLTEQAKLAIQTMGAEVSGPLRVGTLNSLGLHLMGPVFSIFLKNNGNVRLQLKYGSGSELITALENGQIDVAILPNSGIEFGTEPNDCEKELIFQDEMWLVASTRDKNIPRSIFLKDFVSRPVIQLAGEYPGFENHIQKEVKKQGNTFRPVFESSNVGTLKRAIEADLGWGFLPGHSIKKQVSSGRLQRIEVKDLQYNVDLYCYFQKGQKIAKTTEVFLRILKQ